MQPTHATSRWGLLDPAEAERQLGPLAHALASGLAVLDGAGRLLFMNAAAAALLGQSAGELLGRDLRELLAEAPGPAERLLAQLAGGEAVRLTLAGEDGARRVLAATPGPLGLAQGPCMLLTLADVSEEHAAQDRLARQAAYWAQRNVHLALLQHPTLDFAARSDLHETLRAIAHRSARLVEADGSAIFLLDEGALHLSAAWGYAAHLGDLRLSPEEGMLGELLAVGIPVRFDSVCLDERLRELGEGPLIAIPLQHRDAVSGLLLVLRSAGAPQPFSEDDELLLMAISAQAALAIGNARLYDSTRDSLAQLETMTELLEAINSQLELQPLLDRIIEGAAQLFGVEVGVISLLDASQGTATIAASYDLPELVGVTVEPGGLGVTGQVLLTGEPVIVNDTYREVPGSSLLHRPVDHALGAPIRWQGRMLGVFMVGSHTRRFGDRDLGPLTLFAKHAAIAIEKARLFDETRSLASALSSSETRLRAIIDNMPALVYLADPVQGIVLANEQFTELFGDGSGEGLLGKRADDLLIAEEAKAFRQTTTQVYREGAKIVVEEKLTRGDETRHFLSIKFPVRDAISGVQQLGGVAVDITERKRNEERLRQLAALEERQNLARELHDSVTQTLFSMSLNARAAERALQSNPGQAATVVGELRRLAQGALAEMRALIFELRPESLENEGLLAALAKHAAALTARHEIPVESETDAEPAIDIAAKEALYRIAQEAMHNVVKHAGAGKITLTLRHEQGQGEEGPAFVMRVADDGKGFDTTARFPGHLGLISMRERAAKVGGEVAIHSAPAGGTEVIARLPLNGQ
jgi:PAS domain S-box-containing protein